MERRDLRRGWYRTLELVPVAFCAWQRRHPGRHVVDAGTDLVVEGYPAAANTYARTVLQKANPQIQIASHLHSVAHVRRALQLDVPVLVLLRAPVDSVVSTLARFPDQGFAVAAELRRYERLYRGVVDVADQVALARFEDTTGRMDRVVESVNLQFGTTFEAFSPSDVDAQRIVQATIDGWTEVVFGPDGERHRALPSRGRSAAIGPLQEELHHPRYAAARARCEALHRDLVAIARTRVDPSEAPGR